MSLGPFLLGAAVTLILTSVCSAGTCDSVPLGRYCLSSLVGYYECFFNRNTSRVERRVVICPSETRCSCMGIACKTSSPCQRYLILPPILPESYTAEYEETKTVCSPTGCTQTYSRFAIFRDAVNRRYKQVRTISNGNPAYYYYSIVLPSRWGGYLLYSIIPSRLSCTWYNTRFPPRIQVPPRYNFSDRRYIHDEATLKWVWLSGGRPGQGINVQIWDTAYTKDQIPKVVQYTANYPASQMSKTSRKIERYYYMFKPGTPSSFEFQLPTFCRQ